MSAAAVSIKQSREAARMDGWMWRLEKGWRWGSVQLEAYEPSDTFSLFLFSRPVLIISIWGKWGSPNIEPVLIDQACINKPLGDWQCVSRGRGQIDCTDYFHYQPQCSLGATAYVRLLVYCLWMNNNLTKQIKIKWKGIQVNINGLKAH